jgi:glycerol uptake facilitator-like aquaporin
MLAIIRLLILAYAIVSVVGNSGQSGRLVSSALNGGPVAFVHELFGFYANDGSQPIRFINVPVTGQYSGKFYR